MPVSNGARVSNKKKKMGKMSELLSYAIYGPLAIDSITHYFPSPYLRKTKIVI